MRDGSPEQISPQVNSFIVRMGAIFGAPDTANSAEFKRVLDGRVGKYSERVLLATADHFIESRKSWPKIADVISVAKQKHVEASGPVPARRNHWADGQNFARRWFEANADPDLIWRAENEGWRDDLFHHATTIAHSIFVRGEQPAYRDVTMNDEDRNHYSNRARAYREAEKWRKDNPDRFKNGEKSRAWKRPRANQCAPCDAILKKEGSTKPETGEET